MGAGGGNERPWSTVGRSSGGYKEGEGLTLQQDVGGVVVRCGRADEGGPGFEPASCCSFFFLFFLLLSLRSFICFLVTAVSVGGGGEVQAALVDKGRRV